jgi:hypothetical protein
LVIPFEESFAAFLALYKHAFKWRSIGPRDLAFSILNSNTILQEDCPSFLLYRHRHQGINMEHWKCNSP